jgi:hypothetical protein
MESGFQTEFGGCIPQMERLWCSCYRRRHGRESSISGFLGAIVGPADSSISAQLTWKDDRLMATSVGLVGRDRVDVALTAFDAEAQYGPLYFNNLMYLPIQLACAAGVAELDLGPTALYPKVLRGAALRRRTTLIRGTTPGCHQLLRAIGELAGRRQLWKERRALGALSGALRDSA